MSHDYSYEPVSLQQWSAGLMTVITFHNSLSLVSTVSGKMPTFVKKMPIETMDEMNSGVKEEITRRKRTPGSSAGQV